MPQLQQDEASLRWSPGQRHCFASLVACTLCSLELPKKHSNHDRPARDVYRDALEMLRAEQLPSGLEKAAFALQRLQRAITFEMPFERIARQERERVRYREAILALHAIGEAVAWPSDDGDEFLRATVAAWRGTLRPDERRVIVAEAVRELADDLEALRYELARASDAFATLSDAEILENLSPVRGKTRRSAARHVFAVCAALSLAARALDRGPKDSKTARARVANAFRMAVTREEKRRRAKHTG